MKLFQNIPYRVIALPLLILLLQTSCRKSADLIIDNNQKNDDGNTTGKLTGTSTAGADVIQQWYALSLKLVQQTSGHTPPVAARSFGYMGVTLYQSLIPAQGAASYTLAGRLNALTYLPTRITKVDYADPLVINAAMARIVKSLFANASDENSAAIVSLETSLRNKYAAAVKPDVVTRSIDFGQSVADAVFNWSTSDGGHQAYLNLYPSSYLPPVGDGFWIPTSAGMSTPMLPYWGQNRTMVAADMPGPIDPPAPPTFSTESNSAFYNEASIVYSTVNNLTDEQKLIAKYWADGGGSFTPPGHNISIVLQLIRNNKISVGRSAALLAETGIGLYDASIVCWRSKYKYSLLRPVTYIQNNINPSWTTLIATPPFPSYMSGHASFSGATAGILTQEFGTSYSFTDSSNVVFGYQPRSFSSFNTAADEAANSRLYGGIHYRFDNANGVTCGNHIANNVMKLKL